MCLVVDSRGRLPGRRVDGMSRLRTVLSLCVAVACLLKASEGEPLSAAEPAAANEFSGERAYGYLKAICELGPRPSGSIGMQKQRAMIVRHFSNLDAEVTRQPFRIRDRRTGEPVVMENLIVSFHPDRNDRVLLAAHYDTRPYPDRDPVDPEGVFVGANDGASGVAALMELGRFMPALAGPIGVDFVFFDAEEYVVDRRDPYCLGSIHFARRYVSDPPPHRYLVGVLLDMVADENLLLPQERHSITWPDTRGLVDDIWQAAAEVGAREFVPRPGPTVEDDHVPLRTIGRIPTCDIIDFDYPHWHTTKDTPEHCSAASLETVGRVMLYWLTRLQAGGRGPR
jgi:glutaminyl-peptide cyclotransferase